MDADRKRLRLWLGIGLAVVAALALLLFAATRSGRFQDVFGRSQQKVRSVEAMRLNLFAAAEAEKSAVLAETDEDSQRYAKLARAADDEVASALAEYKGIPGISGTEADLLDRFSRDFLEYRKADEEVLDLAVQNTNLKAQTLSIGPAAEALARMEQALGPLLAPKANPQQGRLAARAMAEAYRIQALRGAHIVEKSDQRMDELEARMDQADQQVRDALSALAGQKGVAEAQAAYEAFQMTGVEILRLSRLNTNVRSLALSLDRKTKALAVCDETLRALEENLRAGMAKGTR